MDPKHFEPGLYPNTVDIDVAMNNLIENVLVYQKHGYSGSHVSVDKITQKLAILLYEDESVLILQSSD